ncbi:hypothetical protein D9758_016464 [Tetrapyrgos nigripes]|uniref:Uncharacterized protein n=1 Tax=Tetrapyrgos nigripes TaxID=182062 RepID=A0A8H5FQ38_9AGAR|nr:hypothetical protein D9758_016464 [Tetrapyrgos nigripes]
MPRASRRDPVAYLPPETTPISIPTPPHPGHSPHHAPLTRFTGSPPSVTGNRYHALLPLDLFPTFNLIQQPSGKPQADPLPTLQASPSQSSPQPQRPSVRKAQASRSLPEAARDKLAFLFQNFQY